MIQRQPSLKYTRIYEVSDPQVLSIIKLSFDDAGIRYRTLFEHTLQIANVYALGNNGAIFEVAIEDYDRAKEILTELGINLDYHIKHDRFRFIEWIDSITQNIYWLGRLPLAQRVFIFIAIAVTLPTLFLLLKINRISLNELAGHSWCVEEIVYLGNALHPSTTPGPIQIIGWREKCTEDIRFSNQHGIILPGFNTFGSRGNWKRNGNMLIIENIDQHKQIYEGEYRIHTNWLGTMKFVSPTTTIMISRK